MVWLLGVNGVLIVALTFAVGADVFTLLRQETPVHKNSLARRFAIMFGLAASVPAVLVAVFLGTSLNRGIDDWFSDRVRSIVEEGATIARSNVEAIANDIRVQVGVMAIDLNRAVRGFETEPEKFAQYLREQATFRSFNQAWLIRSDGTLVVGGPESAYRAPSAEDIASASTESVSLVFDEDESRFRAVFPLDQYDDIYLLVSRPVDRAWTDSLVRADRMLEEYRQAGESSRRLRTIFMLGFVEITVLILLFSLRYGLKAATGISEPVVRLARAADAVRHGDLAVRLPRVKTQNEVSHLTDSFNAMTEQLSHQRKTIQAARRDAEQRSEFISTVLQSVSAGVMLIDESSNIILANSSAGALLGSEDDLSGKRLFDVSTGLYGLARRARDTGEGDEAAIVQDRDGVKRHFLVRIAPTVLESGHGSVITFDDTTRLISAQRQTAWRDVARRIAHEIRNPLTPIQLSTERLQRRYRHLAGDEDTVFEKCTETILRQVSDIGRMVEEFSSFARMPKPDVKTFDLWALVKSSVFAARLVNPSINYSVKNIEGVQEIVADERLIGQVLMNIVKNAGEAVLRRHDEVEHGPLEIEITAQIEGDTVRLDIEDTGPGFPAAGREALLEPYYTTRNEGVGLGLAIVERIILDHGGHLSLFDRKDGRTGARVSVFLPVDGPSAETRSSWSLSEEHAL